MIYRILCVFTLLYGLNCNARRPSLRIYGGKDADMKKFPFAILMELYIFGTIEGVDVSRYFGFCSATALSSRWILTAAHCISPIQNIPQGLEAQLFVSYNTTGKPERKKILEMFQSPNVYMENKEIVKNDIGLAKTDDIPLPFYAKLSPVDYLSLIGQEAIYLGYGKTKTMFDKGQELNTTLKMMDVMITKCDETFIRNTPNMCTVPKCGFREFLCPGDSGGTVLHSSGVIGVHSSSIGCFIPKDNPQFGRLNYAAIDVPVSPHIDWITSVIAKNS